MKKVLTILLVISLVLALAAAGTAGWIWFKNNHIFVDGDPYPLKATSLDLREKDISIAYYEELQAKLPNCTIVWNVPFQGNKASSNETALTVKNFSREDADLLPYFPGLKSINITGTDLDYAMLVDLQREHPDSQFTYPVDLGGKAFPLDTEVLELLSGDYDLDTLTENLQYLPNVSTILFRKSQLTREQVEGLKAAYESIEISCTVEILGSEWDTQVTELNLSQMQPGDVEEVARKLSLLPNLQSIELMSGESSSLAKEDVKALREAAPWVNFHYVFDFYGERISTDAEEVYLSKKKIGDEGIDEVRAALDLMGPGCKRFVLEDCGISNELLAQVREEYRGRTKLVWRVYFGDGGSCLTDREVIKAVYGLKDSNCMDLIYCEDAKFCDFGHDEYLNTCEFVSGMPNLEAIILSGSPIKSLEPFRNCKKLKFLEIAFCGYINDLTPLADCESLEMLNISETKVKDLSPIDNLPMTMLCAKGTKIPDSENRRYQQLKPDVWCQFSNKRPVQPYGVGWRYDENKNYLPYYEMLRDVFDYDHPVNTTKW